MHHEHSRYLVNPGVSSVPVLSRLSRLSPPTARLSVLARPLVVNRVLVLAGPLAFHAAALVMVLELSSRPRLSRSYALVPGFCCHLPGEAVTA